MKTNFCFYKSQKTGKKQCIISITYAQQECYKRSQIIPASFSPSQEPIATPIPPSLTPIIM